MDCYTEEGPPRKKVRIMSYVLIRTLQNDISILQYEISFMNEKIKEIERFICFPGYAEKQRIFQKKNKFYAK